MHDQPGVTRDRISAPCMVTAHACMLVDTGGIGATIDDGFGDQVAVEADIAMETADLILFVVDAHDGLTAIDLALSQKLRKAPAPVLLVINKCDDPRHEQSSYDFAALGFSDQVLVSAEHGRNFAQLVDAMDAAIAPRVGHLALAEEKAKESGIRLAIVGKPNAGKSSLVNAILRDDRTIVSEIAGTTRDAVDLPYQFDGEAFTLIDTAGLRPRGKRDNSVEVFSAMRTEKAVRRSDLCVLVIDLASGITAQDRKIARMVVDEKKPCLIVLNKFDLYQPAIDHKTRIANATEHVKRELFFLAYAPYVICSAKTGKAVDYVLRQAMKIRDSAQSVPGTGQLNRILQAAMQKNPPPLDTSMKRRIKLYYATTAVDPAHLLIPVPTIILFVNDKRLMPQAYETYLMNQFRDAHPAPGIPVVFSVRSRTRRDWEPPAKKA